MVRVKPYVKSWFLDNQCKLPWQDLYHLNFFFLSSCINLSAVWCPDLQSCSLNRVGYCHEPSWISAVQVRSSHWYKSLINYKIQNWKVGSQVHYLGEILLPGNKLLDLITEHLWWWTMNQENRLKASLFSVRVAIVDSPLSLGIQFACISPGKVCSKGMSCEFCICGICSQRGSGS